MEPSTTAGQPSGTDSHNVMLPVLQTHSCCSDDHHHHTAHGSSTQGYQSLAMMAATSTFASASPTANPNRATSSGVKSSGSKNRKRKRTSRACVYCQKLHLSCDEQRPCIRCVKAGRCDQCKDGKRKRRGRKRKSMPVDDEMIDEDLDVDIDTVGDATCFSHSDEDDFGEEASSSSVTAGPTMSPGHDDESFDNSPNSSTHDSATNSPSSKRRAVGSGSEPSTSFRPFSNLIADIDNEFEVASMLLGLQQSRGPAIKVFS